MKYDQLYRLKQSIMLTQVFTILKRLIIDDGKTTLCHVILEYFDYFSFIHCVVCYYGHVSSLESLDQT